MPTEVPKIETTTVPLPSGRSLTIRRPCVADYFRASGVIPDVSISQGGRPALNSDAGLSTLKLICEISVEPKLYVDLRPDAERLTKPLRVEGALDVTEFGLTSHDYLALTEQLQEWQREEAETARPFLEAKLRASSTPSASDSGEAPSTG